MGLNHSYLHSFFRILFQQGVRTLVICPGSRSAPLVLHALHSGLFKTHGVVDERSAGFQALGIALKTKEPVGIICTSGTAALNLYPAIAEAYYQNIPLIALTADRPEWLIDQQDGQAIRQNGLFALHVKAWMKIEAQTPEEALMPMWKGLSHGPIHFNFPFEEPLYEVEEVEKAPFNQKNSDHQNSPSSSIEIPEEFLQDWNQANKKLILAGFSSPSSALEEILAKFSKSESCVVIAEALANLPNRLFVSRPEQILASLPDSLLEELAPDILITFGKGVVSKRLKQFLRRHTHIRHWHIDEEGKAINTYQLNAQLLLGQPERVFAALPIPSEQNDLFQTRWLQAEIRVETAMEEFVSTLPWCELKAVHQSLQTIPKNTNLHLANSMAVRYGLQFPRQDLTYHSNRGTSGIEGCTSTAWGFALQSTEKTYLLTGDLAFLYDHGALWTKNRPNHLSILVINNGGGGIFSLIDGPSRHPEQLEYFTTPHHSQLDKLCAAHHITYFCARSEGEFHSVFLEMEKQNGVCVLEIKVDNTPNESVFQQYRKLLASL